MEEVHHFQSKAATALNGAVSSGASQIIVDSVSGFVSAGGQLYVLTSKGLVDFMTYTSGASTTVPVTASTVNVSHSDGEVVEVLYALPTDYAKSKTLLVNTVPFEYTSLVQLPSYRFYSIYNGSMLLPKGIGAQDCSLIYDKKGRDLSTGDDTADRALSMNIPTDFIRYAQESLNAYIFMKKRRREDAAISKALAAETLQDALSYDISTSTSGGLRAAW